MSVQCLFRTAEKHQPRARELLTSCFSAMNLLDLGIELVGGNTQLFRGENPRVIPSTSKY